MHYFSFDLPHSDANFVGAYPAETTEEFCDGHAQAFVRGYEHEVVTACGAKIIARHPRSYEREDFIFDPLH